MEMLFTSGMMSNGDGDLLFYTNGCFIHDGSHETMENGTGLNPGVAYDTGNCPEEGNTVPKGLLTLPLPGSGGIFHLFHIRWVFGGQSPFSIYAGDLNQTVVDIGGNGGLGTVTEKNTALVTDSLYAALAAVRHANNEDWWIVVPRAHTGHYHKLRFTSDGIMESSLQEIGPAPDPGDSGGGAQSCFSPDGARYIFNYDDGHFFLADFDRGTGELSNGQVLYTDTVNSSSTFENVCFSPNSRFLYCNSQTHLWQYDLESADVQSSQVLIAEYDGGTTSSGLPTVFFMPQLAPDCKIYMSSTSGMALPPRHPQPGREGASLQF